MLLAEMTGANSETRTELLESLETVTSIYEGRELYKNYLQEFNVNLITFEK